MQNAGGLFDIEASLSKIEKLKKKQEDPHLWDNPAVATTLAKEISDEENRVNPWIQLKNEVADGLDLALLAKDEDDESLKNDIVNILNFNTKKYEQLDVLELFQDELDLNNAFLTIHSGAGGTESCDWAEMLLRMYLRWADNFGFRTEILEQMPGDGAGIKSTTLLVEGRYAYGYMKAEAGVHRLVRKSPFDSANRRHTSFASVYCSPEVDDTIEVEIDPADLRVDTFRASGAGGQHVNKTDSAIRITHIPTRIVVACQNERSQHQNRELAMKMLKSRLYEKMKEEQEKKMADKALKKSDIAWGSQIRSYVFEPYTLIKDHRTDITIKNVKAVMDGNISEFIYGYLRQH